MIRTENVTINGRQFIHTYSDEGRQLLQAETGIIYDDVYDLVEYPKTYTETGEPQELTDSEALAIITNNEYGEVDIQ